MAVFSEADCVHVRAAAALAQTPFGEYILNKWSQVARL